jgi:hypothetical protein
MPQCALRQGWVARASVWLTLALIITLSGCSGQVVSHPFTITRVSAPHLTWLSALSRISQPDGTKGGVIYGLTSFLWPGSATPQLIINLIGTLYLIGEDGRGLRQLNMGAVCLGSPIVSPDDQTVGCVTTPDNTEGYDRLQIADLTRDGVSHARQLRPSPAPFYTALGWSPDGHFLAMEIFAESVDGSGYQGEIDVFYSPPPHTTFTLAVVLNSDLLTSDICCADFSFRWVSDIEMLFLHSQGDTNYSAAVSLADALNPYTRSASSASPPTPKALSVDSHLFAAFLTGGKDILLLPQDVGAAPFNLHRGTAIMAESRLGASLYSLDLRTRKQVLLLKLPNDDRFDQMEWTPNGRDLLVVVAGDQCVDCGYYPISDVYLYSLRDYGRVCEIELADPSVRWPTSAAA